MSTLTLVDLAGCEDLRRSKAAGATKEEAQFINASLSTLRMCAKHIALKKKPFRDSVLTKILVNSIGGNCKTTIVATVSGTGENYLDSLNTLRFVNVARRVHCIVKPKTSHIEDALARLTKLAGDKRLSEIERADVTSAREELAADLTRREVVEQSIREAEIASCILRTANLATTAVMRTRTDAIAVSLHTMVECATDASPGQAPTPPPLLPLWSKYCAEPTAMQSPRLLRGALCSRRTLTHSSLAPQPWPSITYIRSPLKPNARQAMLLHRYNSVSNAILRR